MSINNMDLDTLMKAQEKLQEKYFPEIQKLSAEEQLLVNTRAMMHEVLEVERELNWKHWKKPKEINWKDVKNEIIDEFIFLMNQWNIVGRDADELIELTLVKMRLNEQRQNNGY